METISHQTYIAKTSVFQGPLDLLLSLIEDRKLFINEISLSSITEDYARFVSELHSDSPQGSQYYEITGYMVVLATLLLIKSRSLLPNFEISVEEKVTIEDLEDRLKLYKVYKDYGKDLTLIFGKHILFTKPAQKREVRFIPDITITPTNLESLITELLTRVPVVESRPVEPRVQIRSTVTLEEVMDRIHKRVDALASFSFSDFAQTKKQYTKEEKVFTVISFLAILELIRTGILIADQDETFGDMNITKNNETRDSYE